MLRNPSSLLATIVLASITHSADAQVIISACGVFTNLPKGTFATSTLSCANSGPSGTGSATADLATGSLHTKATGVTTSPGTASATFADTVTVIGSLSNPIQFQVELDIHGTLSGPVQLAIQISMATVMFPPQT